MDDMKQSKQTGGQYAVRNPWGDIDPVPLRRISPRLTDLNGKTIGLFAAAAKIASRPIMEAVERKLKQRYPSAKFSWFLFGYNLNVAETDDNKRFEAWAKGVDVGIAAVGD